MTLFDQYEYQPSDGLIGKTRLTRVYKGFDKTTSLPVAVKIFRNNESADGIAMPEDDKLLSLKHPNLCGYAKIGELEHENAFGEKESMLICVREYVDGMDLTAWYRGVQSPALMKPVVAGFLRALQVLHDNGVTHRRIKASNLLIATADTPTAKLVDFGLEQKKTAPDESRYSAFVSGVSGLAPEQLNARKYGIDGQIGANIDFWALGLTLYESMTGDTLFKNNPDDSREQIIANILSGGSPEKLTRLPHPFDQLTARCLVRDAAERVKSAAELLELLETPQILPEIVPETTPETTPEIAPVSEDITNDTQVLTFPTFENKPALPDSDDTQILYLPVTDNQVSEPTSDDTQVLTPALDETQILETTSDDTQVLEVNSEDTQILEPDTNDTVVLPAANERRTPTSPLPLPPASRGDTVHLLLNRYEYTPRVDLIGKGGFSKVYRAFDRRLNRWVALKIYTPGDFADQYSPIAEIRRVINLDHPNICRYIDIEEIEREDALRDKEIVQICVMELLNGGNIAEYYKANPSADGLRKLLSDILNGLGYLHRNGIIHRDIKPANLLIRETSEGPVAKITDFGISKLSDAASNQSFSAIVGSIPYMAPEQLNVRKYGIKQAVTFNLDFWSLGVTIYEVMTGKTLFKSNDQESSEQIMANILAGAPAEKLDELPQPFRDIVARCCVMEAADRVQKAGELITLLQRPVTVPEPKPEKHRPDFMIEEVTVEPAKKAVKQKPPPPPVAEAPKPAPPPPAPPSKVVPIEEDRPGPIERPARKPLDRRFLWLGIAIAVAVIFLGVSVWLYLQSRQTQNVITVQKTDSTTSVADNPVTAPQPSPGTTTSQPATAVDSPAAKPEHKRSHHPGATNGGDQPPPARESGSNVTTFIMRLTATEDCSVTIDGIPRPAVFAGKTIKVPLKTGEHWIVAIGTANRNMVYKGHYVVQPEMLGKAANFNMSLAPAQ